MNFLSRLYDSTANERDHLRGSSIILDCLAGRVTRAQYVAFLAQAYHHVKHTTPLLMACGSRLPERLEWLREAVATYIDEEVGHQEWILSDIAACGADAEAVRRSEPGHAADVMVAYAYDAVMRRNPVGFFGMVYVLEGTSTDLATLAADVIQRTLALPDQAFTYLRSHGSIDQDHLKFFSRLMERLEDPADQSAVIHTAKTMYRLYADVFRTLPGSRSEVRRAA